MALDTTLALVTEMLSDRKDVRSVVEMPDGVILVLTQTGRAEKMQRQFDAV